MGSNGYIAPPSPREQALEEMLTDVSIYGVLCGGFLMIVVGIISSVQGNLAWAPVKLWHGGVFTFAALLVSASVIKRKGTQEIPASTGLIMFAAAALFPAAFGLYALLYVGIWGAMYSIVHLAFADTVIRLLIAVCGYFSVRCVANQALMAMTIDHNTPIAGTERFEPETERAQTETGSDTNETEVISGP